MGKSEFICNESSGIWKQDQKMKDSIEPSDKTSEPVMITIFKVGLSGIFKVYLSPTNWKLV